MQLFCHRNFALMVFMIGNDRVRLVVQQVYRLTIARQWMTSMHTHTYTEYVTYLHVCMTHRQRENKRHALVDCFKGISQIHRLQDA